ncbi:hypothetical protein Micbo1qcDRAFT_194737 [Microdochium bolleyi]|uniref:Rhodopsin domain-containing protein n=1 Tax=Microdochium bolleyi TaxID=196109 RepID=A0A136J349_9PEZI|nr:hypothetical protein Micbo1qcDRAFT_194737 [Microdochium bolleyi]
MAQNTTSATLGSPPNTLDDYWTIRALLRDFGRNKLDPNNGYVLVGPRPPGLPYENKQAGVIVGMVVMMLIIIIPTTVRLRLRITKQQMVFGPDDWAILVAALACLLYPIFQIIMVVKGGGGTHTWDVTYTQYRTFIVLGQASRTVYYFVVGMVKLSITLFFRRLADKVSRVWQIVCDLFLVTCVIYVLLALFLTPLLCTPPRAYWDIVYRGMLDTPPQCINKEYVGKILGSMHVAQGALMLTVPIAILWAVRIDRAKKTRLFVNWFVGAVAVVGGMFKTWYFVFSPDTMWTYVDNVLLWTAFDLCLGIVTASVPVLDHLLVSSFGFVASRLGSGHGGSASRKSNRQQDSGSHHQGAGGGRPSVRSHQADELPCSESSENIVKSSDSHHSHQQQHNVELKIMRTTDVNVSYERRDNDSSSDDYYNEERPSGNTR